MIDKIRIYFMGAGKIAIPILKTLAQSEAIDLVGIATQVDRPAGRKKQLRPTPLAQFAADSGLTVNKVESVKEASFMNEMTSLKPDFIVVVSFGQILRQELLDIPRYCCLNIHASILPRHRGASPISTAILNGDAESGVSFMKMDKGLDTGGVYKILKLPLKGDEYADELEENLGDLADTVIVEILSDIKNGSLSPKNQDDSQATLTTKVKKSDGKINWNEPAEKILAMLRAYHPWPGAYFVLPSKKGEIKLNITEARYVNNTSGNAGEILQADKNALIIACDKGALEIIKLLPQGKREMTGIAFLNGHSLKAGIKI
jgi:methionyl-tRNA formyltransferase